MSKRFETIVLFFDCNSRVGYFESRIKSNIFEFVKPNLSTAFIVRECLPSSKVLTSRVVVFSSVSYTHLTLPTNREV